MRFAVRGTIALLAVVSLSVAGCGEQTDAGSSGSEAIGTGRTADYDFTGTTLAGEPFSGASLADKPAVLWFWAPWCPTCRAQSQAVSRLAEKYSGEVAVLGIGGLDGEAAIRDLAVRIPHVTHLVDAEGEVWRHFGVTAQSTYTVIGADGEIKSEGYLDDAELARLVAELAG